MPLLDASFLILFASTSAFGEVKKQTYEDGYYIGEFNYSNQRHGYGIYYFDSGQRYEGSWRNNDYNGYGVLKLNYGDIKKGYF